MMQATARIKYLMMSPRKVRRVVELIKGKSVEDALAILKYTNKAAAQPLAKTIQSATANALSIEGTSHLKAEDLSIAHVYVDEGPRAKRIRFRAMGRVYRYKKRFAHITVVVEGEAREEVQKKRLGSKKADAVETTAKGDSTQTTPESKAAPKKAATKKATSKKTTSGKKTATTKKSGKAKAAPKKTKSSKPAAKKTSAKSKPAGKKK
jgi:large subunit ribosomal protein L22